jgi:hypothetical protein
LEEKVPVEKAIVSEKNIVLITELWGSEGQYVGNVDQEDLVRLEPYSQHFTLVEEEFSIHDEDEVPFPKLAGDDLIMFSGESDQHFDVDYILNPVL